MKYEEIIEIANQASKEWAKEFPTPEETVHPVPKRFLEIFAKLVAQKEREECAKIAEEPWQGSPKAIAELIRTRGQNNG